MVVDYNKSPKKVRNKHSYTSTLALKNMKVLFTSVLCLLCAFTMAQVGINTNLPESTLDIREADPSAPTSEAGIGIPQVTVLPSSGNRAGQLVMNVTDGSFYYYNGTTWVSLSHQAAHIGDQKNGFQTADHNGWVILDGRDVKDLTPNQQANAIALGFTSGNLPDANGAVFKMDATVDVGTSAGSNSVVLSQANLPNVVLAGTTSEDGAHSHPIRTRQDDWDVSGGGHLSSPSAGPSFGRDNGSLGDNHTTRTAGNHTHSVSVPLGGSSTPIDINPTFISVNSFIYLGM